MERLLRRLNYLAFLVHLGAFIFIATRISGFKLPFRVSKRNVIADDALYNSTCGGVEYDEVQEWFDCIREGNFTRATYGLETEDHFQLAWIILIFVGVTAGFHLYIARMETYFERLLRGSQPLRWIEYSITYTAMTLIIFQLNEIIGYYETLLLVVSSFAQMIFGLVMEELKAEKLRNRMFIPGDGVPVSGDTRGTSTIGNAYRLSLFAAWVIMIVHFFIIWDSFVFAFKDFLDSDAGDLWSQLYGFIIVLNVVILVLYLGFPLVHALVDFKYITYVWGEFWYIILSLVSKTSLVVIVAYGSTRQLDD